MRSACGTCPHGNRSSGFTEELGVASVALSPDGKRLATGSWAGHVRVWDWAGGKQLFDLPVGDVARVTFAPDGRLLATVTEDKTAQLWDMTRGKLLADLEGDLFRFHCVTFSPDGTRVLAGGGDWKDNGVNQVTIWDVQSKAQVNKLVGHSSAVLGICYSPDGKTIATGSVDRGIRLWDAVSGKQLHTLTGHQHWVEGLVFTADSKTLISGSMDATIRFWNVATGKETKQIGIRASVRSLCFTPDGEILIAGGGSKTLKFVAVKDQKELAALWDGRAPQVSAMDLFPIASTVAPLKKGWLAALGLVGLGMACFVSLSFAVARSLRHPPPEQPPPEPPAPESTLSFSCAQCGKRLKGKAAHAGKTIKCPGCGKPTQVPEQQTVETETVRSRPWWKRLDVLTAGTASGMFAAALLVGIWLSRPPQVPYVSRLQMLADRVRAEKTDIIDARPFPSVSDRDLTVLRGLSHLRDLNLDGTETTDEGLKEIATATGLASLSLTNTRITEDGLAGLANLTNLEFLRLDKLPITDAALVHLRALTRLRIISLYKTGVTDKGMAYLKDLPALEEISLDETQVGDEGLLHLSQCKTLKKVKVWNTRVTPAGIQALRKAIPGITVRQ